MIDSVLVSSAVVALCLAPAVAPALLQQSPKPFAAQGTPSAQEISGFSVVLVVGEAQAGGTAPAAQDLPSGARKALVDMREFLPYKHYRVLDAQWTSCCAPKSRATVLGRLQGIAGQPGSNGAMTIVPRSYGFTITAGTSTSAISMRFVLGHEDTARAVSGDRARELERERQDLKAEIELVGEQVRNAQQRAEVGIAPASDVPALKNRHASLQRKLTDVEQTLEEAHLGGQRPIIDSSFTMQAGETVVVGTSRLGGDKALIALVTAVKKNETSRDQ